MLLWTLWASFCLCADQDIITILEAQSGLSSFIEYLKSYPDLVDIINEGAFTGAFQEGASISSYK